ncbi:MAG: lipid-A-disaccharide synthase [Aquificae bacterium]|nr:lipid-A-disaccharide synthase [Aquificota bacterium]
MREKRVFISVGEISADNYASELIKKLPEIEWVGIAGPKMRQAGCKPIETIENLSVVGITEIIPKYLHIRKVFNKAVQTLKQDVDMLIVVDYPGFNLKLLKEAKKLGIKTVYFIAPQVWAWGEKRIKTIVKYTDLLIAIWPFEKDLYKPYQTDNFKVEFVGHPILDIIRTTHTKESFREKLQIPQNKKIIGLFPGSRENEIKHILPIMLKAGELIYKADKTLHFVLPVTQNLKETVNDFVKQYDLPLKTVDNTVFEYPNYETMNNAFFSIITSGTATLEASIFTNPFIVVYKVSPLTYMLGKMLIKIPYISLPNIIAQEEIVKELIQDKCTPINLANWSLKYIFDKDLYMKTKIQLKDKVKNRLGEKGALDKTAKLIKQELQI